MSPAIRCLSNQILSSRDVLSTDCVFWKLEVGAVMDLQASLWKGEIYLVNVRK
jgi:hypothetical protein